MNKKKNYVNPEKQNEIMGGKATTASPDYKKR